MLDMTITKHLSDVIHETIYYSGLEGEIIGTPAFNRLHNILQSSLVYLTYPSNKVKRFEHSVGTMKLAGDIFYHSVCNTDSNGEEYKNFFAEIKKEILQWRKNTNHATLPFIRRDIFDKYDVTDENKNNILNAPIPHCVLYNMYTPGNLKKEDMLAYFVAFQSVRICGLLHDVGHLPYSHVLESFLTELYYDILEKNKLNDKEKHFKSILSKFITEKKEKRPVDAIHEKLGILLFDKIFESITEPLPSSEDETRIFLALVRYFSKKILSSNNNLDLTKENIFRDLHLIISGVLDADRLDYCNRDLNAVGIKRGYINYNRLLSGVKIKKIVEKDKPLFEEKTTKSETTFNGFCFCPAAKHIDEIENLISLRWNDFAYLNFHHRVHKHEILMEEVLKELAKKEFKNSNTISFENVVVLPLNISSIWEILEQIGQDKSIEYLIIQLDDNWLNTLLKQEFFNNFKTKYTLDSDNIHSLLWHRFDEIISSKKHYFSLVKGTDTFRQFDENFFNEMKKQIESRENNLKTKKLVSNAKHLQKFKKKTYLQLVSEFGLSFNYAITSLIDEDEKILEKIEEDINKQLSKQLNVKDVIVQKCQFSLGYSTLTHPVYVHSATGTYDKLDHRSQQLSELQKRQKNSAFFHCYYLPEYDSNHLSYKEVNTNKLMVKLYRSSAKIIVDLFIEKEIQKSNK